MAAFTRIYLSLFPCVAFAPLVIVIASALITLRISAYRWIAHVLTFVALLVTLPLCVWLQGRLAPSTIEYPGPGDGFVLLLYLFFLVPAVLFYAGYAWFTRRKPRVAQAQSAAQG